MVNYQRAIHALCINAAQHGIDRPAGGSSLHFCWLHLLIWWLCCLIIL